MSQTGPLFVSSGDLVADRRYKWALDCAAKGDFAGAADILAQTVELAPGFATAWFALGAIRDHLGDHAGAALAFEQTRELDPEDYHGARLQLARLGTGEATPAMTHAYVRRLFDQYAARYDTSLTDHLAYRGPAILREAVERVMSATARPFRFDAVLDLGCGTGLAGAAFRPVCGRLTGVDLSEAMVAKAAEKNLYDRLESADLVDFLQQEARGETKYNLVIAADVFVYLNELSPIFTAVARLSTPGGLFAFTAESHAGAGVKLLPTLRYAYAEAHLQALLGAAGFSVPYLADTSVRSEKGRPVESLVVVAQKSGVPQPPPGSSA
jgi:predicted TPR repeat methyltransferase